MCPRLQSWPVIESDENTDSQVLEPVMLKVKQLGGTEQGCAFNQ
jgi:hypothetical protein